MRFVKISHFIAYSFISIIIFAPYFNLYQINPIQKPIKDNNSLSQLNPENITLSNYLFSFNPFERNHISDLLELINPESYYIYRNLPLGFVTLSENQVISIQSSNPQFYSKMSKSEKHQVIPSQEILHLSGISKTSNSEYRSPATIIKATELWDQGIDGTGIKIAIIDTGIDPEHKDFTGRISYQTSFVNSTFGFSSYEDYSDYNGHGTHVAGIAAGSSIYYPGIAYNADLYNLKVAAMGGYSTKEATIAAIDEAIELEVDIISLSLGFDTSLPWGTDDPLNLAVDYAVEKGILIMSSAGNEGDNNLPATITSPASASKVISVGATNANDEVASFSSRGPSIEYRIDPDIMAPGVQIIGPLAHGSAMDLALNSVENFTLTDYAILTGTSMAAPVISGALALLKQQYPTASVSALRAAIQETAIDLGESIFHQGSGLIDVNAASNILKSTQKGEDFELISSLPKNTDSIEFSEFISFPGDNSRLSLSFMTGISGVIEWEISNTINDFITFDISSQDLLQGEYFEKNLIIGIPFNTPQGSYQGNISYTFLETTYAIHIELRIKNPNSKIYWESHYTGRDDSPFFNYRTLEEYLAAELLFDINQYDGVMSWENISQNNIIVLTDLEYPLSNKEIEYISNFHHKNGSILLITSAFPYYNPQPYEQIANVLDIPVNFSDTIDLIDYIDDGGSRDIISVASDVDITWELGNPLFEDVDELPFFYGTAFSANQSNPYLKHLAVTQYPSYLAVAGYEPPAKGKVLVLGCELWLYSFFLSSENGKNFARNIFDWLQPNSNITVNSKISFTESMLETFIYTDSQMSISMNISFSNGTKLMAIPFVYNESLGRYHSEIFITTQQPLKMSISLYNASMTLKEFEIINMPHNILPESLETKITPLASSSIITPSWVENSPQIYFINEGLEIFINNSESNSIYSVLVISSQLEDTLSVLIPPIEAIRDYTYEFELLNDSSTSKSFRWNLTTDISTGFYSYEVYTWLNVQDVKNFSIILDSKRGLFYIPDPEPRLSTQSVIAGRSLEYYRNIETISDIPYWQPGDEIELNLISHDVNSEEFTIYIQFVHYYFWIIDRMVIDSFQIKTSSENKSVNNGIFIVPDESIPIPGQEDFKIGLDDQIFILFIYIRDQQGNYDMEPIFFIIGYEFDIDPIFLVFGMFAALGAIVIVIYIIRRSSSRRAQYYSPQQMYRAEEVYRASHKPTIKMKFCPNCGKQIPPEARYCSYCGNHI